MSVRDALERVSAAISSDAGKARAKNAPAKARLTQGLRCEVSGPHDERLYTDMPPAMGGAASAPNPQVDVESESDNRGMLGLDAGVSAGLGAVRMKVRIAGAASPQELREIVAWADAHSVVGCTIRQATGCSLDVEATSTQQ
jgi:hypothetical protein